MFENVSVFVIYLFSALSYNLLISEFADQLSHNKLVFRMAGPFIFMPGSFNNNFPPPPRYEDIPAPQNDAQPQPIIVAVFGKTGTGKSSFIKAVTGKALEIGHGLESCKTTKSSHVS
jgi:ribosome biogenesis GTPase A